MSSYNKVFLMGNLTRNVELRYTPSGTAVADIGIAINEILKNKAGEQKETTVFVDVVVWNKTAEHCADYLKKGSHVFVDGKLQLDSWESQGGEKRSRLRVKADRVVFLDRKDDATPKTNPPTAPQTSTDEGEDVPF